jgi:proteasome lid subunit RPN8/RPN11
MITIQLTAKRTMTNDAIHAFPDECCGFFFGSEDKTGNRMVTDVLIVNNSKQGDKKRRFEIAASDYLEAERYADENNVQLLGVYHSHPNHPAIPSEHDRVAAQPYFSYLIISVLEKKLGPIRSWRLDEESRFEEEEVSYNKIPTLINSEV